MTVDADIKDRKYWKNRALSAELSNTLLKLQFSKDSNAELVYLRNQLQAIENSSTWKMTAPIRRLINTIRSFRAGPDVGEDNSATGDAEEKTFTDGGEYNWAGLEKMDAAQFIHPASLSAWKRHLSRKTA